MFDRHVYIYIPHIIHHKKYDVININHKYFTTKTLLKILQ